MPEEVGDAAPEQAAPEAAAAPGTGRRNRSARRRPAVLALLIVAGAALAVLAGSLTWWRQRHLDALAGAITTTATGSQTDVLLVPAALVALAGFGAALATTGLLRRLVGLLLLIGGGVTAVLALIGVFTAPALLLTSLPRPAESSAAPDLQPIGAALGVVAGALISVAGVLLVIGYGARRTLGSRYDAPTSRRARAAEAGEPSAAGGATDPVADAEASAQWWKALDAGRDPTDASADGRPGTAARTPGTTEPGMS